MPRKDIILNLPGFTIKKVSQTVKRKRKTVSSINIEQTNQLMLYVDT